MFNTASITAILHPNVSCYRYVTVQREGSHTNEQKRKRKTEKNTDAVALHGGRQEDEGRDLSPEEISFIPTDSSLTNVTETSTDLKEIMGSKESIGAQESMMRAMFPIITRQFVYVSKLRHTGNAASNCDDN